MKIFLPYGMGIYKNQLQVSRLHVLGRKKKKTKKVSQDHMMKLLWSCY